MTLSPTLGARYSHQTVQFQQNASMPSALFETCGAHRKPTAAPDPPKYTTTSRKAQTVQQGGVTRKAHLHDATVTSQVHLQHATCLIIIRGVSAPQIGGLLGPMVRTVSRQFISSAAEARGLSGARRRRSPGPLTCANRELSAADSPATQGQHGVRAHHYRPVPNTARFLSPAGVLLQ